MRRWLEEAVLGLNLCPFAAGPHRQNRIRLAVSGARSEQQLLLDLQEELLRIDAKPAAELETTLLIIPNMLAEFDDYNQFLDLADALLRQQSWQGHYQIASFHPHYRFAGTASGDSGNLTNCSPYPILHILREASVAQAVQNYSSPEQIPQQNIRRIENLTAVEISRLFPYASVKSRPHCKKPSDL